MNGNIIIISIMINILYIFLQPVIAFPKPNIKPFRSLKSLKTIVFNRAFYSSFIEKITLDPMDETYLIHHPIYFASAFTLGVLLKPNDSKLENVTKYQETRKISRNMLTIIFVLFVRNVESAT